MFYSSNSYSYPRWSLTWLSSNHQKGGDCKCIKCPPLEVLEFDDKTVKGLMCLLSIHRRTVPDEVFNHKCRPLKMLRNIEETKVFLKKVLAQNPEETGSWSLEILKKLDLEETGSWRLRRNLIPKIEAPYWRNVKMKIKLKRSLR